MRKQTKKAINNRLDKLWSKIIRSKEHCEVCETLQPEERPNSTQLHPHHIITRGKRMTRWDLKNGCCLCASHHTLGQVSAHKDGLWFADWMKKNRPEDVQHLNERRWRIKQRSIEELLLLEEGLKELLS